MDRQMKVAGQKTGPIQKIRMDRKAFAELVFPDMELRRGAVSLEAVDGKARAVMYRLREKWFTGKPGDGVAFVFGKDGSVTVVIEDAACEAQ